MRVGLIGTGNIAETHAAALRATKGVVTVAVADISEARARRFAERWGVKNAFGSAEALAASGTTDVVHVLVPPPLHAPLAQTLLAAGLHVFLEKPMAETAADCDLVTAAAVGAGRVVDVNHNFVHHPAHCRAKAIIAEGRVGRLCHAVMHYNMPLRQLAGRQFGHWMFASARNLFLEQAVHPLSQLDDLVGALRRVTVLAPPPSVVGGQIIARRALLSFEGEAAPAQLYVSLGESFPAWGALLLCSDGIVTVDYIRSRVTVEETRQWPDAFAHFQNGLAVAGSIARQEGQNVLSYGLSLLKLRPRSDGFFRSMHGSIGAFYAGLADGTAGNGAKVGRRLVALCEDIAASLAPPVPAPTPRSSRAQRSEVAVIGGTGFIGQYLVKALVADGKRVAVLARNTTRLAPIFDHPEVEVLAGDATRREDVARAVDGASHVVNLAHGGGGSTYAEIERGLVGGATTVAEAALAVGVQRLVFVSSIAALYLGDGSAVITGATPTDPAAETRADYARAKAAAEAAMLRLHQDRGLPVTILRPGLVVGEGTSPFHSGLGFYNAERHCIGWNAGRNSLPFVLAADVAAAIALALSSDVAPGRAYNLVGDVTMTAREYTEALARALGRPLRFHPQSVHWLYAAELAKGLVKRAIGRRDPFVSLADLRSRGLAARFDCSDAKRDLGWHPVADRERFLREAILVHAA